MDLTFILDYNIPVILGICLCIGYVIKTSIPKVPNNIIPLIMAILGVALNVYINKSVDATIILGGLVSGLASTGLYEAFRNIINGYNKE